jgi:Cu/Ag efflux protein CusF
MSRLSTGLTIALTMLGSSAVLAQQPAQPRPQQSTQPSAQPAQPSAPSAARPAVGAVASASAMATVEAINMTTREVTLKKEDGSTTTIKVGEEARNLAQVEKGDRVIVTYEVGMVVALGPPGSAPVRVEDTQAARTPAGAKPGGVIRQTTAVTATIVGIDTKARTVTLKGPKQTVELAVADDIDLTKAKVGDQVGAVYQEALGILVEPAPK